MQVVDSGNEKLRAANEKLHVANDQSLQLEVKLRQVQDENNRLRNDLERASQECARQDQVHCLCIGGAALQLTSDNIN